MRAGAEVKVLGEELVVGQVDKLFANVGVETWDESGIADVFEEECVFDKHAEGRAGAGGPRWKAAEEVDGVFAEIREMTLAGSCADWLFEILERMAVKGEDFSGTQRLQESRAPGFL